MLRSSLRVTNDRHSRVTHCSAARRLRLRFPSAPPPVRMQSQLPIADAARVYSIYSSTRTVALFPLPSDLRYCTLLRLRAPPPASRVILCIRCISSAASTQLSSVLHAVHTYCASVWRARIQLSFDSIHSNPTSQHCLFECPNMRLMYSYCSYNNERHLLL